MEPTTVVTHGRTGTYENPEVFENVPGQIIPIIEAEFEDFETEAKQFLDGQTPEDQFIGFRLKQGVYGQRQPGVQMIRVKLPFGGITPDQMDAFADVVEQFAPLRKGHITTRQNVQIHHIPLDQMEKVLRRIGDSGLSSREGCGNTVRNVTGDPWAGVSEGEPFDPTPYAGSYVRYFVRNDLTQLLPRKWKTAFSATDKDVAITGIHDYGLIPKIKEVDGEQVKGFEIRIGGGTSIMPRVACTLYEFVPVDDFLKVTEACLRIFNRQEDLRKNRARARIKVMVDRVGIDEFHRQVGEELKGDWVNERDFSPEPLAFEYDEEVHAPPVPESFTSPNGDKSDFERFLESNVQAQRQDGFSTVEVKITRGDLTPKQFRGLGQIMRDFSGGFARTTVQQNVVLRWVRNESIYDVWLRLKGLGLGDAGAREITDVVSCPGTDSCKLGITSSMGLNQAVKDRLDQMAIEDPITKQINVKMSGCPNGCSQHHVANIGFYGASMKVGGQQVPAYIPHVGGHYTDDKVRFGARLKFRIPAKRVPEAVERFIYFYEAERQEGEEFNTFVDRVGAQPFEKLAHGIGIPEEYDLETMDEFIDWNRSDPYKVERGEGECAI